MIKIGILGAGHLGKIHISLLKEIKEFEIVGFFDSDKEVSARVEKEFGFKSYPTYEALSKNCDAIDIVCPTPFHFEYAQKAIKAGKHVFIEKPVTIHPEETKLLVQLCHEAGVVTQVGRVEQFNPAFLAAKPFINRPLFITTERLATYNPRGTDVSVVLDLMIHDIDLVLSMVKSNIKKIQASGSPIICNTADIVHARIDFDNGTIANLTVSRVALSNKRSLQVFQKEGFLSIDLLNKTLTKAEIKENYTPTKNEDVIALRNSTSIIKENIEIKPVNAIKYELELFAKAIQNKTKAVVTLDDEHLTMQTAQQIINAIGG
ncbi:MAG TPA: Gfo/Idh/MocA family oxidoreductase [Bacteroidia bacterium]|nr:Gfo/Idh/MocA family oxidoreductase [Bacteroidia bacterium]